MGVLAFMSISFVLIPTEESSPEKKKTVEFQWVGAPAYVQPVFFHCRENTITFENVFLKTTQEVTIERLLTELQQKKGAVLQYFQELVMHNEKRKRAFETTEHYPLLLIYPNGVLSSELMMSLIEQVPGLNIGLEPMLPQWEVPYQ